MKKNKNIGISREDKMMVLLEDISGQVKAVAEGHSVLERKIDNLGFELGEKIGKLELRMDRMEIKMDTGFKLVLDHIDGLDKEFMELKNDFKNNYDRKGNDPKWRESIEDRVEKLEKALLPKKLARA